MYNLISYYLKGTMDSWERDLPEVSLVCSELTEGVRFPMVTLLLLLLSRFSRVRLCDPIDRSLPGSPIPGILQERTLEWVAISFSSV